jgi:hypothetical protein
MPKVDPQDLKALLRLHLDRWTRVKTDVVKRGPHSRYEADFELRFVLFLAENIDGFSNAEEKAWAQTVAQGFEWSSFHVKQLESRIHQLPSFEIQQCRLCRELPALGELAYQLAVSMCWVDGELHPDEEVFLNNCRREWMQGREVVAREIEQDIKTFLGVESHSPLSDGNLAPSEAATHVKSAPADLPPVNLDEALAELDALTGLESVKGEIKRLVSFLDIQKQREVHGLPQAQLSLHMVFTGSPGTGKTTVARLVAKIYRAMGILKKGHLVETDRSGLVGQYIGHTEVKTHGVIQKALDGILFIDEAYALVKDSENDFGQEAIDALVKRMEDDRHRLVVIVAGYDNEMRTFLEANVGLRSRFNTFVHFEDYRPEELLVIFKSLCERNQYKLDEQALSGLPSLFEKAIEASGDSFGNGRFVRNLFEGALRFQAFRLSQHSAALLKEDLITLSLSDLQQATV